VSRLGNVIVATPRLNTHPPPRDYQPSGGNAHAVSTWTRIAALGRRLVPAMRRLTSDNERALPWPP
jgi:hypothetical protein